MNKIEIENRIKELFNQKLNPDDHVFKVYVFKADKNGIRHCFVATENDLEIECNITNDADSIETLNIKLLKVHGSCEVSVGPFKGESCVTISLEDIPFEKWCGNNGAIKERNMDNGFNDKNEENTNTEQRIDLEPTAGDEVREFLNNGEIKELFPDEEEPYCEFKTDFFEDPLEIIKLYGYLNHVEVGGWSLKFDGVYDMDGNEYFLERTYVDFNKEKVSDMYDNEYFLERAYVNPRFDDIMVDLKSEINEWLDCTTDEVKWVWDRDKWDEYKERWYSAHGIHEYGKTPYAA